MNTIMHALVKNHEPCNNIPTSCPRDHRVHIRHLHCSKDCVHPFLLSSFVFLLLSFLFPCVFLSCSAVLFRSYTSFHVLPSSSLLPPFLLSHILPTFLPPFLLLSNLSSCISSSLFLPSFCYMISVFLPPSFFHVRYVLRVPTCQDGEARVHAIPLKNQQETRRTLACSSTFLHVLQRSSPSFLLHSVFLCFVLEHDARHSHHREDRRDAETAHCVCIILFYLNSNSIKIYHSICQLIDKSFNGSTSPPLD